MNCLCYVVCIQTACDDAGNLGALNDCLVNHSVMGKTGCTDITCAYCLGIDQEEIGYRLVVPDVLHNLLLLQRNACQYGDCLHDLQSGESVS